MKPSQLKMFLESTIKAKYPVLVAGAPGIGKTDIVKQAAVAVGANVIISHPVISDPTDYKGLPAIVDGKAEFLPFGELLSMIEASELTAFFFDDVGQAEPAVQKALMQPLLAREINGKKVSEHVAFVGATNRKQHKAGVTGMLEPVKSRFKTIVELEPDLNDWVVWALKKGVPTELIACMRFKPNLLHDFQPTFELVNSPCPRTIHNVGDLMSMDGGVPQGMEFEVYKGAAGEGFAVEFLSFLKVYRNLPNVDKVIMDPDNAPVPDMAKSENIPVLYALCGALSHKADEENFGRIVRYANRMPEEFSVLLVTDAVTKNGDITNTRAFIEWAVKHKDVVVQE